MTIDTNKAREIAAVLQSRAERSVMASSTAEDIREAAALLLALADAHDSMARDAARYRWLTTDHDDPETRRKCRELLDRMAVISYSAASRDIDAAMGADNG